MVTDHRMPTLARALEMDPAAVAAALADRLRQQLAQLQRRGFVVAMSGGVDSSVCAALAVRAVGPGHVLGLSLPEPESEAESLALARGWAAHLGIDHTVEDIGPTLQALGCYRRRDTAIRRLVPEFGDGWRSKLVLSGSAPVADGLPIAYVTVQSPDGAVRRVRLPAGEYHEIVAATSFKQRTRKMVEYYHADCRHYAVVGTPNRLEYDQGFFVKGGDGLADVKPIAHLYKTQVYALAEYLGVPASIRTRIPTTDTYSLSQTQEEFYFALPTRTLDLVLFAHNAGRDHAVVAEELECGVEDVRRAIRDVERKRAATRYLHLPPLLAEPVPEACSGSSMDAR